jgi:hypothetical protein
VCKWNPEPHACQASPVPLRYVTSPLKILYFYNFIIDTEMLKLWKETKSQKKLNVKQKLIPISSPRDHQSLIFWGAYYLEFSVH